MAPYNMFWNNLRAHFLVLGEDGQCHINEAINQIINAMMNSIDFNDEYIIKHSNDELTTFMENLDDYSTDIDDLVTDAFEQNIISNDIVTIRILMDGLMTIYEGASAPQRR